MRIPKLKLLSPRKLLCRLALIALSGGAAAWTLVGVLSTLWAGCDQVWGAAFLACGVFLYVCAIEVFERGNRL